MKWKDERAYALGFRPVKPEEVEYLYVPGYVAPKAATLAAAPELQPSAPSTRRNTPNRCWIG
jgi:hypothetical protein